MNNDNTVKRYEFGTSKEGYVVECEHKDGDWVLYSDHIEAISQLEKERDKWQALYTSAVDREQGWKDKAETAEKERDAYEQDAERYEQALTRLAIAIGSSRYPT